MNSSGKVLTVFLVIFVILSLASVAVLMFYFQKEIERRKLAEFNLHESMANGVKIEDELKEVKKQSFLLQEKNKEADERINSLLDDLELEEALREEVKNENSSLKEQAAQISQERDKFKQQSANAVLDSEEKILNLEKQLEKEIVEKAGIEKQVQNYAKINQELEETLLELRSATMSGTGTVSVAPTSKELVAAKKAVELEKIVVIPNDIPDGRVLSVDKDTEFLVISLGEKDGVTRGNIFSVYRGKDYLGDVKVTRIQPEMSAADLIPPFSSRLVRKNDQVVIKQ